MKKSDKIRIKWIKIKTEYNILKDENEKIKNEFLKIKTILSE